MFIEADLSWFVQSFDIAFFVLLLYGCLLARLTRKSSSLKLGQLLTDLYLYRVFLNFSCPRMETELVIQLLSHSAFTP